MILSELKSLIEANAIAKIVLYVPDPDKLECEVWAYDWDEDTTVSAFGNRLVVERTKEPKTYTSFDRAWIALRGMGYKREMVIDSTLFKPS
jgi:hypothetical protein